MVQNVVGDRAQEGPPEGPQASGPGDDVGGPYSPRVTHHTVTRVLVVQRHELTSHLSTKQDFTSHGINPKEKYIIACKDINLFSFFLLIIFISTPHFDIKSN